ncbi:unnamed protein product [Rotaria sordida]|uniref:Transmembrane protein n=1 Tax=Rotaria sordida TaxID=392033 RepID=A0A815F3W8_9BILA|nr:unnamed protein product [Rotaria sordida]CAF1585731.1 unnamed protein product [Rotaria sordida]
MTTDPLGLVAYGFSDLLIFFFNASATQFFSTNTSSFLGWTSFEPYAIDYDGSLAIIAGFLMNERNTRITYDAAIVLLGIDASTGIVNIIHSWQIGLTNPGAKKNNPEFAISVSINPTAKQALVGIQSMNTVFLFSYTNTTLTLITSKNNGRGIGFGKGVAWLSDTLNSVVILVNVYSTSYVWSSSKVYVYDSPLTNTSRPISIFPNNEQPLYRYMSPTLLNIITTSRDLALLGDGGGLFVILSADSGYYASTIGPNVEAVPAFSSQLPCIPGTYKNVTGIRRCSLCPPGTKNDGTNPTVATCVACAVNTFCPLGSTNIIGGLRIGLSGPGKKESSTATLQDLGFSKTFNQSEHILGTDVHMTLQLTKVINNTSPLVSGDDEVLSGIWIGSFLLNDYESFITNTEYLNQGAAMSTTLTLTITETLYYVLNEQSPIARLPEIVYHDFLYITTIIGMVVLVFVIVECKRNSDDKYQTDSNRQSVTNHDNAENSIDNSNGQPSNRHTHNFDMISNVASVQRPNYTSDQYANSSDNNTQQSPTLWNYQTYF